MSSYTSICLLYTSKQVVISNFQPLNAVVRCTGSNCSITDQGGCSGRYLKCTVRKEKNERISCLNGNSSGKEGFSDRMYGWWYAKQSAGGLALGVCVRAGKTFWKGRLDVYKRQRLYLQSGFQDNALSDKRSQKQFNKTNIHTTKAGRPRMDGRCV